MRQYNRCRPCLHRYDGLINKLFYKNLMSLYIYMMKNKLYNEETVIFVHGLYTKQTVQSKLLPVEQGETLRD
jgi:hypothetical protein